MTSAQLAHLAEQADFAAGFFKPTNPAIAERFAQCAGTAREMATRIERQQELARIRAELADIARRLEARSVRAARSQPVPVDAGQEPSMSFPPAP